MPTPKLSIGLPVYNGQDYLRCALDSILQQNYGDFELIISDNASSDGTQQICREYSSQDPRIRYHRNELNIGASANYNRVFELARCQYFKWAAHDDVHLPGCLRRCIEILDAAPENVVLVSSGTEIVDENGATTARPVENLDTRHSRPHQRLANVLRRVEWGPAQFGVYRTDSLRRTGLIRPFRASDYILLAEIALLGQIWEFPEVLFQRRFHPGISTVINRNWREMRVWFAPSEKGIKRFVHPNLRLGLEFLQAVSRIGLPLKERLPCYRTIFTVWYPRQWRQLTQPYRKKLALGTRLKRAVGKTSKVSSTAL